MSMDYNDESQNQMQFFIDNLNEQEINSVDYNVKSNINHLQNNNEAFSSLYNNLQHHAQGFNVFFRSRSLSVGDMDLSVPIQNRSLDTQQEDQRNQFHVQITQTKTTKKIKKQKIEKAGRGRKLGQRQSNSQKDKNKNQYHTYLITLFEKYMDFRNIESQECCDCIIEFYNQYYRPCDCSLDLINRYLFQEEEFRKYFIQFLKDLDNLIKDAKCKIPEQSKQNILEQKNQWITDIYNLHRIKHW